MNDSSTFRAMEMETSTSKSNSNTTRSTDPFQWCRRLVTTVSGAGSGPKLFWSCLALIAVAVLYTGEKEAADLLEDEEQILDSMSSVDTATIDHYNVFPGMDDKETMIDCCPANIIVGLERHHASNSPMPYSTLLFDNSNSNTSTSTSTSMMCNLVSIENYPACCGLPKGDAKDDDDTHDPLSLLSVRLTIPEWSTKCIPDTGYSKDEGVAKDGSSSSSKGFLLTYGTCHANLLWDERSCDDWIQTKGTPRDIIVQDSNLTLVDGEFTNCSVVVSTSSSTSDGHSMDDTTNSNAKETSIFIPDAFDSCWQVDCAGGANYSPGPSVSTIDCIQFARDNLRRVSLEEYVTAAKQAQCK